MNIRLVEFGFNDKGVYDYKTNLKLVCTSIFPKEVSSVSYDGWFDEVTFIMQTPKILSWDEEGNLWIDTIRPTAVLSLIQIGNAWVKLEHPLDEEVEIYGQVIKVG